MPFDTYKEAVECLNKYPLLKLTICLVRGRYWVEFISLKEDISDE